MNWPHRRGSTAKAWKQSGIAGMKYACAEGIQEKGGGIQVIIGSVV